MTDNQYANLLSAFFWAYALFQLPAGRLGDRYGARLVLSAYLFLWSLRTGLMGAVSGFAALLALRLGCGLFEAGAYPWRTGLSAGGRHPTSAARPARSSPSAGGSAARSRPC